MAQKTRIIDTTFGEVQLRQCYDCDTNCSWCEMYIGDNYDDYIGDIDCNICDDEENILEQIEEKLYY